MLGGLPGKILIAVGFLAMNHASFVFASGQKVIRVLVFQTDHEVRLHGTDLVVRDGDLDEVLVLEKNNSVSFHIHPEGLVIGGLNQKPRSVRVRSKDEIRFEGKSIGGEVEVIAQGRQMLFVNHLPLERYLHGLVGVEMPASWPKEALKAQAVASRTYALFRVLQREALLFDVTADSLDQVYAGLDKEDPRVQKAVDLTLGEVLVYQQSPVEALFHSCCGGTIRSAKEVFGNAVDYLSSKADPYCETCPHASWEVVLSAKELKQISKTAGYLGTMIKVVPSFDAEGRRLQLFENSQGIKTAFTNHQLRTLIGFTKIPSNDFYITLSDQSIRFLGKGRGHGVGMCQWGAFKMAQLGHRYQEILNWYYPKTTLRKMY